MTNRLVCYGLAGLLCLTLLLALQKFAKPKAPVLVVDGTAAAAGGNVDPDAEEALRRTMGSQGLRLALPDGTEWTGEPAHAICVRMDAGTPRWVGMVPVVENSIALPSGGDYAVFLALAWATPGLHRISIEESEWGVLFLEPCGGIRFYVCDEFGAAIEDVTVVLDERRNGYEGTSAVPQFTPANLADPVLSEALLAFGSLTVVGDPPDQAPWIAAANRLFNAIENPGSQPGMGSRARRIERATDTHGRVEMHGLSTARTYSWTLRSDAAFRVEPAQPIERFSGSRDAVRVDFSKPARSLWSSAITLGPGQVLDLAGTVYRSTAVTGRLNHGAVGGDIKGTSVALYSTVVVRDQTGAPLVQSDALEFHDVADAEGFFRFSSVAPGQKKLTALWWTAEGSMRFRAVRFTVEPGDEYNLGLLSPLPGSELIIHTLLQDAHGVDHSWSDCFPDAPPGMIHMVINSRAQELPDGLGIFDRIMRWELGVPIRLLGLPDARYHINSEIMTDSPESETYSLDPAMVEIDFDKFGPTVVSIVHRVFETRQITIRVQHPPFDKPFGVNVHFIDADGVLQKSRGLVRESEESSLLGPFAVRPGRNFYFIATRPVTGIESGDWLATGWAESESHDTEARMELGLMVKGRVSPEAMGRLNGRQHLSFHVVGWPIPEGGRRPHFTTLIGSNGEFTLRSIPRNAVLVESVTGVRLVTGSVDLEGVVLAP